MIDYPFINELNIYVGSLLKNDSWQELHETVRASLVSRSICDITAYIKQIRCPLNAVDAELKIAVFEQTLYAAELYLNSENGRTVVEENISGFASRRYSEMPTAWISPRAKAYIDGIAESRKKVRILN